MPQESLARRVEKLEEEMTALAGLLAQVGDLASQVSQLRAEMRAVLSAIRGEIRAGDEETRAEARDLGAAADEPRLRRPRPNPALR